MKILITGGAGFIGSHLVDALIESNHQVVVVDDLLSGKKENIHAKAIVYYADITETSISDIFEREHPEIVFHLAAQINLRKSVENPADDVKINVLGSINILENCKKHHVKKIIFSSSAAVYGAPREIPTFEDYPAIPLTPYGIDKLTIEKYLHYYFDSCQLPYVALRFANVYGPRQNAKGEAGVISVFCQKIVTQQPLVIYGSGEQTRDFVYVDDVVAVLMLAMENNAVGIFNVGTQKETTIHEVCHVLQELSGVNGEKIYLAKKPGDQLRSCLDCSKTRKIFDWQPAYSIERGLQEIFLSAKNSRSLGGYGC